MANPSKICYFRTVNAEPVLSELARALAAVRLETVLIGNAAAALHGAPVTTLDFDFCYRDTPVNARKLKELARRLNATLSRPGTPVSDVARIERADMSLLADFLPDHAIGVRFAELRAGAKVLTLGTGAVLRVAALRDVADMKRRAGRPKDQAALYAIEATIQEIERRAKERARPR